MKKVFIILVSLFIICSCASNDKREYIIDTKKQDSLCFEKIKDSLGLSFKCIGVPYTGTKAKAVFYIVDEKKDTFYYAIDKKDSVYLWAIKKGTGIHLVRDL